MPRVEQLVQGAVRLHRNFRALQKVQDTGTLLRVFVCLREPVDILLLYEFNDIPKQIEVLKGSEAV
jgi:hypothetical protein